MMVPRDKGLVQSHLCGRHREMSSEKAMLRVASDHIKKKERGGKPRKRMQQARSIMTLIFFRDASQSVSSLGGI